MKLYGEISKTEELNDGTIKVWGYASTQSVDADGEVVSAEAMKAALPDYMKFGAVREMHQPKAAGTAIEAAVQDDGRTWFGAHVVDSEAVKKVKAGVYKGFSIGGRVTERDESNKALIKAIKLVEISLVDRPANPEAVFTVYKAETVEAEYLSAVDRLADLLNRGAVVPERLLQLATRDAEAKEATTMRKSLGDVQDFAAALQNLGYICASAEWERQMEGDASLIPEQLRAWLAQGMEIFQAMAAEELGELLQALQDEASVVSPQAVAMSAQARNLIKAGARFSEDTRSALAEIHQGMHDLCGKMDALGYKDKEEGKDGEEGKGAQTGELHKYEDNVAKAEIERLSEALHKADARIRALEAQPAPGKALLKAVAKGQDIGHGLPHHDIPPVRRADGSTEDIATLIKSIHANGGQRIAV